MTVELKRRSFYELVWCTVEGMGSGNGGISRKDLLLEKEEKVNPEHVV